MLLERGTHTIITAYLKTVSKLAVTAAVCPMTASSIKKWHHRDICQVIKNTNKYQS